MRLEYRRRDFAHKPNLPYGLQVEVFAGSDGHEYEWAPKWEDVREMFIVAAATELFNTEGSGKWDELREFEDTARDTIDMVLRQVWKGNDPSLKAGA